MNDQREVERCVRRAERERRRCGVPRARREELSEELTFDLREATAGGRSPEQALEGDPASFARAWAHASGLNATPRRLVTLAAAVVAGAGLVALIAYLLTGGGENLGLPTLDINTSSRNGAAGELSDGAILATYLVAAVLGYLAALALAGLTLAAAGDDRLKATMRALAWAVPAGAAAGTLLAVGYAYLVDYSLARTDIALEAGLAAGALAASTVAARLLALRRRPHRSAAQAQNARSLA